MFDQPVFKNPNSLKEHTFIPEMCYEFLKE